MDKSTNLYTHCKYFVFNNIKSVHINYLKKKVQNRHLLELVKTCKTCIFYTHEKLLTHAIIENILLFFNLGIVL